MYILVNTDLKMGTGKIAGQCCHAACMVTRELERLDTLPPAYQRWTREGETKIVLKATEELMLQFIQKYPKQCKAVWDLGRTQIPANSLTALAFCPMLREDAPAPISSLKLL